MGRLLLLCVIGVLAVQGGCVRRQVVVPPELRTLVDRKEVDYPSNARLTVLAQNLTAPIGMAFDVDGNLLVAEGGIPDRDPWIFGIRPDGSTFDIYPRGQQLPFVKRGFRMYGPIGGIVAAHGAIYVSHRDANGAGVITRFDYEGNPTTIVAGLPAQGDHSVTDLAVHPGGRIYFGVGSATNSGVVGLDNLRWLKRHRTFCDQASADLYLLGRRFDAANPFAGLFGGSDIAVTAPFQPFGQSIDTYIRAAARPNAAIYSVSPSGGDVRLEAHGIRLPVGLGFNEFGAQYATNQGMKLRGTRPVKDDPDVLLRIVQGQWYGWPDYSADLRPIRLPQFQPPADTIVPSGYRDLSFLIDHASSNLSAPNRETLLRATFPPLSGAAKFDFAPASGPFSGLRQGGKEVVIVALWGDRAPFDTGGRKLIGPQGRKLVKVVEPGVVSDFVSNVGGPPGSETAHRGARLQRPIDVKFGPDGAMYILDYGRVKIHDGGERVVSGTGRIYRLSLESGPSAAGLP